MEHEDVIKRPLLLTEKGNQLRDSQNKYLFEVHLRANKFNIRNAVETLFKVSVIDVNTLVVRGKSRRVRRTLTKPRSWKKAIVTLKEGDSIDFLLEGGK